MENQSNPQRFVQTDVDPAGEFLARGAFYELAPLRSPRHLLPFETHRVATDVGEHPIVRLFDLNDQGQKSIRDNLLELLQRDRWSCLAVVRVGYRFEGAKADDFTVTVLIHVQPDSMTSARAVEIVNKAADFIYWFALVEILASTLPFTDCLSAFTSCAM